MQPRTPQSPPTELPLVFSESIVANFSGVELAMLTMPGMTMDQPMMIDGVAAVVGANGKTLIATPPQKLEPLATD